MKAAVSSKTILYLSKLHGVTYRKTLILGEVTVINLKLFYTVIATQRVLHE